MVSFFKKYKIYLVLIFLFGGYLFFLYSSRDLIKNYGNKKSTIIIDGINAWQYSDGKWNNIYDYGFLTEDLKFKVYSFQSYYGEYSLKVNDDVLYAFDSEYNSFQYDGSIFAYQSNYNMSVFSILYLDLENVDINLLNSYFDDYSKYSLLGKKIVVDLNHDGSDETVYIVNYYNGDENIYSAICIYDGKKMNFLFGDIGIIYNVSYIVDIDNDNKYELFLSSKTGDSVNYSCYKYKKGKWNLFLY